MGNKYGFNIEQYESGHQVETLQTGDGKTEFTDLYFDDGQVGIAMTYGDGIGIDKERTHPKGTKADAINPHWQIKFPNAGSLNSMIGRLLELQGKDLLPPADCSLDSKSCPDNEGHGCWCSRKAFGKSKEHNKQPV